MVKMDRFFPSSKMCSNPSCLQKNDIKLAQRSWTCSHCESYHDRDINAAINIERQAVSCTVIKACGEE
ncbi:MAG: zinc ribbon domain-containing protein, partial [Oligoflexales bacterium]